jgi:hypothetical protein
MAKILAVSNNIVRKKTNIIVLYCTFRPILFVKRTISSFHDPISMVLRKNLHFFSIYWSKRTILSEKKPRWMDLKLIYWLKRTILSEKKPRLIGFEIIFFNR